MLRYMFISDYAEIKFQERWQKKILTVRYSMRGPLPSIISVNFLSFKISCGNRMKQSTWRYIEL